MFWQLFVYITFVYFFPSRTAAPPASPVSINNDTIEETTQDGDIEMTDTEMGKEMLPKEDTTFMVGQLGNKSAVCLHF